MGRAIRLAYLDTHVAGWLAQNDRHKLPARAKTAIEQFPLRIAPMVYLELEYLYEIKRTIVSAVQVAAKLRAELGVEICDFSCPSIAHAALSEKWTHDPFDRTIVAQARANGQAPLITADKRIRANYSATVW